MTASNDPARHSGARSEPRTEVRSLGPADPDQLMTVTVTVRPRSSANADADLETMSLLPIGERSYPSREDFAATHGSDPADLKQVVDFARGHGLRVVKSDPARRRVVLSAPARDMASAFGVTLERFAHQGGEYLGTSSPIRPPAELASVVESILGLDNRPAAEPRA
jgi:kumamolisin